MPVLSSLAQISPPAAGAPVTQIIIGTAIAGSMTGAVLILAWLHRSGRTTLLDTIGRWIGHIQGVAPWAALPLVIGFGSLGLAFLGVYWDISLHVDKGRDPGPLANAAHYPILFGLQGLFLAGVLALVLPPKNAYVGPTAVKVGTTWRTPTAAIALMSCATIGYLGFPLDDVWHRLFGQDVTLWGPTHLMMIFGAVLSILALAMLQVEGERAYGKPKTSGQAWRRKWMRVQNPAAMLIAGSLLAGEWDWGIQQYLMLWRPVILAAVTGLALVYARRWGGRGAAFGAALFYCIARFIVNLIVGEGFGQTMPSMPLFFVEALIVEGVAMVAVLRASTFRFALASGIGIGTLGFGFQYWWSQFAMPTPWEPDFLFPAIPLSIAAATAAGVLGGLLAQSLRGELRLEPQRRWLGYGSTAVLVAIAGIAGNQDYSSGPAVTTTLSNVKTVSPATGTGPFDGEIRDVTVTAKFTDVDAAERGMSIMTISWQGGGVVSNVMEKIGPGEYRTTEPIPVGGSWKTVTRMQLGRRMLAVPVQLPADPAIPVEGHTNPGTETQQFKNELLLLQRERRDDVPAWLWLPAIILVLGGIGLFTVGLGVSVARLGLRVTPEDEPEPSSGPTPDPAASAAAKGASAVGRPHPAS
ncbi:MAG: hypothetical protein J7513_05655 [Solirubrobacteraceae bacterium]|nr:hypothetical protein [Solirubrobacteraceae bacterium]